MRRVSAPRGGKDTAAGITVGSTNLAAGSQQSAAWTESGISILPRKTFILKDSSNLKPHWTGRA